MDSLSFALDFGSLCIWQTAKGKFVSFFLSIVLLIGWAINVSFDSFFSL